MPLPKFPISELIITMAYMSHHFRDMATYSLKRFIENCNQTAADKDVVSIDNL